MMHFVVLPLIMILEGGQPVDVVAPDAAGLRCNLATVKGLNSGHLLVRDRPSPRGRIVGRLSNGAAIRICNERRPYLGVVITDGRSPCTIRGDEVIDGTRARDCTSGWVHRDWVEVLTG